MVLKNRLLKGKSVEATIKKHKVLNVFMLVMINIIAIDSLRTLPIAAEYGASLIFFYLIAAIGFFIPSVLITAELATGWPNTGGVYVWVTEAFGKRAGLLTIWLQWIYAVVWYPTILAFLAGMMAYLIDPSLANNKIYTIMAILSLYWLATLLNCFGVKLSGWINTVGALIGTILPMLLIIILGIIWTIKNHASFLHFNQTTLLPSLHHFNNLGFLTAVLFGLMGIEMSAVHAGDVKNPQRDYPRALLWSALIILITLIGGSLAIAVVVPPAKINLVTSLITTYQAFFEVYHLTWMVPIVAGMIILGSLSGIVAWILGPARGLNIAAVQGNLPAYFAKVNAHGAPARILILQGIIVTLLCSVFLLMPSVNSSYWILTALTAQLGLLFYLFLFAAFIRLRYLKPQVTRAYQIPGGKLGAWLVAGLGILTTVVTLLLGFLPPDNVQIKSITLYEAILIGGIILFTVPPFLIKRRGSKNSG